MPLYLHHRYQLTAAVKTLGGVRYSYAVKDGDSVRPPASTAFEPADRQRAALGAVLETLDSRALVLPVRLLELIPPQAFNRPGGVAERFDGRTGLVFDPVAAAVTAADLTVIGLLNPQRAVRLIESHAGDPRAPGFHEVLDALIARTCDIPTGEDRAGSVIRAVQWLVVTRVISLAGDEGADPRVRAVASAALERLARRIEIRRPAAAGTPSNQEVHGWAMVREIRRFLDRPDATHRRAEPPPSPPGDPIGANAD